MYIFKIIGTAFWNLEGREVNQLEVEEWFCKHKCITALEDVSKVRRVLDLIREMYSKGILKKVEKEKFIELIKMLIDHV
jgi:hypothetical protein